MQQKFKKKSKRAVVRGTAHHTLVSGLGEGLFIGDVPLHPAVGDHVAGDGGVIDCQRAFPAHDQCCLV